MATPITAVGRHVTVKATGLGVGVGPAGPGQTWRGEFDGSTQYEIDDLVEYDGSVYIAVDSYLGATPPPSSPSDWDLYVARGLPGTGAATTDAVTAGLIDSDASDTSQALADAIDRETSPARVSLNATIATEIARGGACHIVVAGGQSNAVQSDTTIPIAKADQRLFKWSGSDIVALPSTETYLLPSFAREYIKTLPAGDWVLVVPSAVGSSGFTSTSIDPPPSGYHYYPSPGTWDRTLTADPNNFYANMVTETLQAKAAAEALGSTTTIDALLWSQGEDDTPFLDQAAYAAKLDDLIATFRTDVGVTLLPVVVGSMVPEYARLRGQTHTADVAAALSNTPARNPGGLATAFVYGPEGLPKTGEVIHYSTAAQIKRGAMFVDGLFRARVNRAATPPTPPAIVGLTREASGLVTLTWTPAMARVTFYEVDFTFDGGTTWVPGVVDPDSRQKATSAALPWEPVKARIRSRADGAITASEYVYSVELGAPRDGTIGTLRTIVPDSAITPAHTGAMTLYAAFTLPASGGEVTVNARSNDSTRQFYLTAKQASSLDLGLAKTSAGDVVANFPAPKATPGPHVNAASISADGTTIIGIRGSDGAVTSTASAGGLLAEILKMTVSGGAVSHGAYIVLGHAHDEATMESVQSVLQLRHGLAVI